MSIDRPTYLIKEAEENTVEKPISSSRSNDDDDSQLNKCCNKEAINQPTQGVLRTSNFGRVIKPPVRFLD